MKLDDVKKLQQKKYRTQLGYYLVEGEHLILELQKSLKHQGSSQRIDLYVSDNYLEWTKNLTGNFNVIGLNSKQMASISDTKTPQGLIACVPLPQAATLPPLQPKERCIYLHEVQDPGNLGTILRTLAWFGNFRLLVSPNSVDPFNPKVVRASMGAIFHLPLELDVKLEDLDKRFDQFAYLDLQGAPVNSPEFSDYQCYLFGNEARGVPNQALKAFRANAFTIAGCGAIDSLNLASTVGMCAYQLSL